MGACLACLACEAVCAAVTGACSCIGCCCSGNAAKDTPRNPLVGKIRTLVLLCFSVVLGLVTQYWFSTYLYDGLWQWRTGCEGQGNETYQYICAGNNAIYRISFVDTIFFLCMAGMATSGSLFNNKFWSPKILFWCLLTLASIFVPNYVVGPTGYVWPARFGAFIFTILEQIVLIDLAYRWNDAWVTKAQELGEDSGGRPYLISLVVISLGLYVCSIVFLALIFVYFDGCSENETVTSLTLVLCVIITIAQLTGNEGNLLTSALVTAYSVFLNFSAVSKNPNSSCNPFVGGSTNYTTIVIGFLLTVLAVCWISLSASKDMTALMGGAAVQESALPTTSGAVTSNPKAKPFIAGSAVADAEGGSAASGTATGGEPEPEDGGESWKYNLVMVLIAMYFGMMLTNWGVINKDGSGVGDQKNGKVALWLTIAGQWVCLLLYLWTLIAPRLFPDRVFS